MKRILTSLALLLFLLVLIVNCKKEKDIQLPSLTTNAISDTTFEGAKVSSTITSDGGSEIYAKGVCFAKTSDPTINEGKTIESNATGVFTSILVGLEQNTTYYVRAYAINNAGVGYGNQLTFKTNAFAVPTLTTEIVQDINYTCAKSGGKITFNGGSEITSKGLCWSISPNPTINDNKVSNDYCKDIYISSLSALKANTTYYVRAYATNSAGTGYGNEVSFKTKGTAKDIEGNIYHVVSIGDQVWMVENLKVTKYNDGNPIPVVTENSSWAFRDSPAFCWYNNDISNKNVYGGMYNWYAVNTNKLCPEGWHVPTNDEWKTLTNYLGGLTAAAGKLKEAGYDHWKNPNSDATNESKFTALPAGYRSYHSGGFFRLGENATFWSSTSNNSLQAWSRAITNYDITSVQAIANEMSYGISVRCILNK